MSVLTARRRNGRPRGYVDAWRPQTQTRTLLAGVLDVLDRYEKHLPLTIRQVYYALVGAERLDKTEAAYERLCYALNQARRSRMISFADLRDDGVSYIASDVYASVEGFHDETGRRAKNYRRDRQAGQECYVELWCEAAGMMPQLATVADTFSVPVYSCGGFASLSAVRQIADRAIERNVPTIILHVGDFDPSGESIFTAMTEDAAAFVEADRVLKTSALCALRIALTRSQVALYDLPSASAKASDSRSASWRGGTCQLEALAPDVLAGLVREAILGELDAGVMADVLRTEKADRAELLALPVGSEQ